MTSSSSGAARRLVCLAALLMVSACQEPEPWLDAPPPLQPLIYTELPGLTPDAAALRERRMLRDLVGVPSGGEPVAQAAAPVYPQDAQELGELFARGLLGTREVGWEDAFAAPEDYARMVKLDPAEAARAMDEVIAASLPAWRAFGADHVSQLPEGGLDALFSFEGLTVGAGRTLAGRLAYGNDVVAQRWGNVLTLGLRGTNVRFDVTISKILHIPANGERPAHLAIAGPVRLERRLEVFLEAGLHLKPELLRSQEYPYPLSVGNFWRYRRYRVREQQAPQDELLAELSAPAETFDATEVLQEVMSIERHNSMRLVRMRWSYNDQALTKIEQSWLVSPRRIYLCDRTCLRRVEELDWLLRQLPRETPLFVFDRARGERVLRDVEVPAGAFIAAHITTQRTTLSEVDPFIQISEMERAFAPGRGLVRQELRGKTSAGEPVVMVEELVESRIMP
jgi:hypothetical protein